jgi:dipeptidase D
MKYLIEDMEPALPFHFFEEIAAIPRPSGREQEIADYLCAFAREHALFVYRDAANNVLIKKPATKGRENEPALLLQAHTDMVAEKNEDVLHDFTRDPIRLVREGNILHADGTTLGADDGSGVAVMLALLCEAPSHPPLECLFTSSEEVGLVGAAAFDYSLISARRMFNLDGGCEKEIVIGCCGGLRTDVSFSASRSDCKGEGISLCITGLCGGHSGEDIDRGRSNALSLMAEWLHAIGARTDLRIISLHGGDKDNAIPRECRAEIMVPHAAPVLPLLEAQGEVLKRRCAAPEDAACRFLLGRCDTGAAFTAEDSEKILHLLASKGGVLARRADGTPHTSRNIASVRTTDEGVQLTASARSYDGAEIEKWRDELVARATAVGASALHRGAYPGWESPADSALIALIADAFCQVGGERPVPVVIHAGLECGLITDRLPGMVAASMGPNANNFHTPAECMELDSFARFYRALLRFLEIC